MKKLMAIMLLTILSTFTTTKAQDRSSSRATGRATPRADQRRADALQQAGLNRLRAASSIPLKARLEDGALRFAMLNIRVPANVGRDNLARANWFLNQYSGALRLREPSTELQFTRRSRDGNHIFFRRRHNGIPVFPGALGVHFNGSQVMALAGNYVPEITLSPIPLITAIRAEALAKAYDKTNPRTLGDTQLRYVNLGLLGIRDKSTHLAWRVNLTSGKTMYIDANSGARLYTSSRVEESFDLELDNSNNNDPMSGPLCGDEEDWFDENGKVSGANPDAEGWLAFNNIKAVDSYFRGTFLRDAHDNDGEDIEVYVHTGNNWVNASYSSGCDIFQFGDGMATLDIMGHEFTHGIDSNEAELEYVNESGALDESFADIFGSYVDGDWLLGDGSTNAKKPVDEIGCTATFASRDLSNPPCHNQPDRYNSPLKVPNPNHPNPFKDFGGVHTNSGINNKAAFLITAGGTFNGRTITGIGQTKAQRLFYAVLTNFLWDSAQMIDARDTAVLLADAWSSFAPLYGFTRADLCQVRNAYKAVELGNGDIDCNDIEESMNLDSDNDSTPDASDNCPNVSNPGQSNLDGDNQGDACDADIDGDGDLNAADNCVYTANPDQANFNGDGVGDKCDDTDGDMRMDAVDNCWLISNTDQKNTDGDDQGDACDEDIDGDGDPNTADNCPLKSNPSQANSDNDIFGNACDLCPGVSSPDNTDTDEDGQGNPCDTDDDEDGYLDTADNCPLTASSNQYDIDGDGIGFACDKDEQEIVNKGKNKVASVKTKQPFIIPVPICPQCGDILPEGFQEVVRVSAPKGFDVRVINSDGKSVADGKKEATNQVLKFQPSPYSSTATNLIGRSLTTATALGSNLLPLGKPAPDRMRYYLVITPPSKANLSADYNVAFEFTGIMPEQKLSPSINR